jgi:AcrR family transcriptional regulator
VPPKPDLDRAAEHRAALAAAGAVLIAERGLQRTTMAEVCRAAGMSPGSAYRYVAGKADLVVAIAEAHRARLEPLAREMEGEAPLLDVLDRHLNDLLAEATDPVTARLGLELTAEALRDRAVWDAFRGLEEELLDVLAEAARRDGAADPAATAATVFALFDGLGARAAMGPVPEGIAGAVRSALRGLLAPGPTPPCDASRARHALTEPRS